MSVETESSNSSSSGDAADVSVDDFVLPRDHDEELHDEDSAEEEPEDHKQLALAFGAGLDSQHTRTSVPCTEKQQQQQQQEPPASSSDTTSMAHQREFRLTFSSNVLFILASVLYLWVAVSDLQWEALLDDLKITSAVLEADDDATWEEAGLVDDDYVWQTPRSHVWVSEYMMLFFAAALCFVLVGALEYAALHVRHGDGDEIKKRHRFLGVFLILAGCFGVLASLYTEKDEDLSNIFDFISVVMFLLEAIQVIATHPSTIWLQAAAYFFFVGSALDVIVAGLAFVDYSWSLAVVDVFSATCWLVSALLHTGATMCKVKHGGFQKEQEQEVVKKSKVEEYAEQTSFEVDEEEDKSAAFFHEIIHI